MATSIGSNENVKEDIVLMTLVKHKIACCAFAELHPVDKKCLSILSSYSYKYKGSGPCPVVSNKKLAAR